ncbi:MAG: NDP-sugar synthase [Thermofilum sp.]
MKLVVLAGGRDEKMKPLSEGYPKALLHLAGRPLCSYALLNPLELVSRAALVVSEGMEDVAGFLSERGLSGRATVLLQRGEGVEAALLTAEEWVGSDDWFMLAYGDIVAPPEAYRLLLEAHSENESPSALVVPVPQIKSYGAAAVAGGRVITFSERRGEGGGYAVGGAFVLPRHVFRLVERYGSFFEALNTLVEKQGVAAALWTGDWVAVDYPWDLISAAYIVLNTPYSMISPEAKVSPTAVIEGSVIIERGAVVDHFAVIKGPAYIGKNAFIGKGAFIREYTLIEKGAVVGAFAEVKRSVLQPEATVGSYSLIVDSVLGPRSVAEPRVTVISSLKEEEDVIRELPLQGVLQRKRKLGVFVAPGARLRAGSLVGPAALVHRSGVLDTLRAQS